MINRKTDVLAWSVTRILLQWLLWMLITWPTTKLTSVLLMHPTGSIQFSLAQPRLHLSPRHCLLMSRKPVLIVVKPSQTLVGREAGKYGQARGREAVVSNEAVRWQQWRWILSRQHQLLGAGMLCHQQWLWCRHSMRSNGQTSRVPKQHIGWQWTLCLVYTKSQKHGKVNF